jgi:hypothetical protein
MKAAPNTSQCDGQNRRVLFFCGTPTKTTPKTDCETSFFVGFQGFGEGWDPRPMSGVPVSGIRPCLTGAWRRRLRNLPPRREPRNPAGLAMCDNAPHQIADFASLGTPGLGLMIAGPEGGRHEG